jgi:uncharacterized membrane protein SpoIIM required for sporulation
MKETAFIKQNKKKWARFEKLYGQGNSDPDEVSELFTEITEDLSYAKTFYSRRSVRVYLNQLAQGVFTSLYKQRKQPLGNFAKFWSLTLPLELYRARWTLLSVTLFFLLTVFIGAISQHYDHDFVRIILGDYYVEMTEENIRDNNPMGVYGDSGSGVMFWQITVHNIQVAFMIFAVGIMGSIFSYFFLLSNGVMLGAFQWWFYGKGLLMTTFLTIWIHGAFEISSIIIAGAAGITVGNGLLFPRSFSRVQSLIFAARRGLYIMLSLIPFFIIAGFLESYVTRHYQSMPDVVKWGIILLSFAIMIFYYVIYPQIVARRYPEKIEVKEIPRFVPKRNIEWFKIRNVGEIFTDTFYIFIDKISPITRLFFTVMLPLSLILTAVVMYFEYFRFTFMLPWHEIWGELFGTSINFEWFKILGWSTILTFLICGVYFIQQKNDEEKLFSSFFRFAVRHFIWIYMYALMMLGILFFSPGWLLLILLFITPFLNMIPCVIVHEKTNFFNAFARSFNLGGGSYGDSIGSFCVFFLISAIFFLVLINPYWGGIIGLFEQILVEMLNTVSGDYYVAINAFKIFFFILFLFFSLGIYFISFSFGYFTSKEKNTAKGLYDKLESFGKRKRNRETDLDFE